jgi:hypothetical protein
VVEAGTDLLAYDVIESVNNTVRRTAEEALKAKALTGAAVRDVARRWVRPVKITARMSLKALNERRNAGVSRMVRSYSKCCAE